jgi:osmotically-inducible protein OsmY
LGDDEVWDDGGVSADFATRVVAAARITTRAKVFLMADPGLYPLAVNVDTHRGVVTLFGSVKTEAAKDDDLRAAVLERIKGREGLEDAKIDVEVENSFVRMSGTVTNNHDRLTALNVAQATTGVGSVIDDLAVERHRS